jgi:CubicO group peptidase (beta-lactamase class C family)
MDITHLGEALDALVPEILDLCGTPGASIAVGVDDAVVFARGYGHADLATNRPMTTDTTAPTGSDGKTYTAAAVMQLVERGYLGLDDPINEHLDGLRIVNPHGQRAITLRDLLTHRSGLSTGMGNWDRTPPAPLGEHLRRVFATGRGDAYGGTVFPFWATPVGVNYQYSNLGLAVVGYLVELLNPDRVSFSEWVRRHVFEPLGMHSTRFPPAQHPDYVPADLLERRSVGYATLPGHRFVLSALYPGDWPAGSALTTPSDHARFILAMINHGRLGDATILRRDTAKSMITPQAVGGTLLGPSPEISVGLVWNVFQHGAEDEYFGHGGSYLWGWNNFARGWTHRRVALVVNTNQYDLGDFGTSDRPSHLAGRLVAEVVGAWARGEDPRPKVGSAALRSRMLGLLIGDRLTGRVGITTPLSEAEIAEIADAAVLAPGTPWDPTAFRETIAKVRMTDHPLRDNLALTRRELPSWRSELLARQLGVPGLGRNMPQLD